MVREHVLEARESVHDSVDALRETLADSLESVKPKLRGWLHAGTFPVVLIAGGILIGFSTTPLARASTTVFIATAALLFGVSAIYHRGNWSPRTTGILKRIDHANIFLIIAGTYTPFAVLLLPWDQARQLLIIVWTGALLGMAFRVLWVHAPRWMYVPMYAALGWVAIGYLPSFWNSGDRPAFYLVLAGGLLYTIGAVVYGVKRPNPSLRWFGFHEVFHALTVAAFALHYTGVSLVAMTH